MKVIHFDIIFSLFKGLFNKVQYMYLIIIIGTKLVNYAFLSFSITFQVMYNLYLMSLRNIRIVYWTLTIVTFELFRSQGLSRAAYARLYTAVFPPVLDRNSEPPEVIDPNVPVLIDLVKEEQDSLQCNEIVFQFLAFSK